MTWNVWRLWELTLHKYLRNVYLCWEFALPSFTLLSISVHFKQSQLNDFPSQPTKLVNIFLKTPSPPQNFFYIYRCTSNSLKREGGWWFSCCCKSFTVILGLSFVCWEIVTCTYHKNPICNLDFLKTKEVLFQDISAYSRSQLY